MFKQLLFVCILVLIVTAKKHNQGSKECPEEKCPNEFNACIADSKCKPTIQSCMALIPENPSHKEINEFEACVEQNQTSYDFMDYN